MRGPRAGSEKPGAGAEGREASARHVLGKQRRHRRLDARRRDRQQVHRLRLRGAVEIVRLECDDDGEWARLRPDRQPPEGDGGLGSGRSPADDRDRKNHQRLLAHRIERENRRLVRSGRRLSEPSLCDENELGLLRDARENLRGQIRRRIPGHPQRRGDRHEGAARPVQDEYGRGDVGARQERPRRLARQSHRRNRRSGERRRQAAHRHCARSVPRRPAQGGESAHRHADRQSDQSGVGRGKRSQDCIVPQVR